MSVTYRDVLSVCIFDGCQAGVHDISPESDRGTGYERGGEGGLLLGMCSITEGGITGEWYRGQGGGGKGGSCE